MRAILIPVKEFHQAKQRLAMHVSPQHRASLAQAMCADLFRVVSQVRCVNRVFVISKEAWALSEGRSLGWETISESSQTSESQSVDAASHYCASQGVQALLRIPIDIPLTQTHDIDAVFDQLDAETDAVIVPSSSGTGTNAILRTPPDLFPSRFGPNSFLLHQAEAARCAARMRVYRNPRLELDVDELEDLKALAPQLPHDSATSRWFAAAGLAILGQANSAGAAD
jgi:2-phospho-L-lactate/phosphoenolpyruvate guanylyltransferase